MTPKIIPATEFRGNMAKELHDLKKTGLPCLLTRNGRPVAAVLSIEQFEKLMSMAEDYLDEHDEELARDIKAAEKEIERGEYTVL